MPCMYPPSYMTRHTRRCQVWLPLGETIKYKYMVLAGITGDQEHTTWRWEPGRDRSMTAHADADKGCTKVQDTHTHTQTLSLSLSLSLSLTHTHTHTHTHSHTHTLTRTHNTHTHTHTHTGAGQTGVHSSTTHDMSWSVRVCST